MEIKDFSNFECPQRTWTTSLANGGTLKKMRTMYPKGADPKKLCYAPGSNFVTSAPNSKLRYAGIKDFGVHLTRSGHKVPTIHLLRGGDAIQGVDAVREVFNAIRKYGMKLL